MPYFNYYKKSKLFHGSAINIMGTRLDVIMIGEEPILSDVWMQIIRETEELHNMFNRFDAASEISHINREAAIHPVELNGKFWEILIDIKKYHQLTQGYFDVSLSNFNGVILDNNRRTVTFAVKDISLDFGGYAKGYALEQIRTIMLQTGVTQAFVNFGNSSILALGAHPNGKWWGVGVENPFLPGQQLKTYELCNQSLSTSGNTAQHKEHIINPRFGKYTAERKLVSVVSENAVETEVLSTALMVADETTISAIKKTFKNVIIDIWE